MPSTPVAHKANVAARTAARRDPDATRARLLKVAVSEFVTKGYNGARMEQLAARAA